MKSTFRQSMAWLHTWAGLLVSWLLYFMFVTGTLAYLDTEIDRWMQPEISRQNIVPVDAVSVAHSYLQQHAPNAQQWVIHLPVDRNEIDLRVAYQNQSDERKPALPWRYVTLDPSSGQPVTRGSAGGQTLYRMHYSLHYLPGKWACYLVGVCTMFMLTALITGLIFHKRIFKDVFTFRPGKGSRSWQDAHTVLAVISLPFYLMITYTGFVMFMFVYMPLIITGTYGHGQDNHQRFFDNYFPSGIQSSASGQAEKLLPLSTLYLSARSQLQGQEIRRIEISYPGDSQATASFYPITSSPTLDGHKLILSATDASILTFSKSHSGVRRVYTSLSELHEALYAGPYLRALHILSGLLGCAMIATGMLLWVIKRRERELKRPNGPSVSFRLVEGMNIGTIAGLPIAILSYFWANRLLPTTVENRADWEVHCLFITWLTLLLHGLWFSWKSQSDKAWDQQLALTRLACILLPLVNVITTERGFLVSVQTADWLYLSVDLLCLCTAALCTFVIRKRAAAKHRVKTRHRGNIQLLQGQE